MPKGRPGIHPRHLETNIKEISSSQTGSKPVRDGTQSTSQITAFEDTWEWNLDAEHAYQHVVEDEGQVADAMRAFRTFLGHSDMMAPRLIELKRVLKPTGSIYLHCDPTASLYLKMLMDSIFGPTNFRNEIIWKRTSSHSNATKRFGEENDSLLYYSKTESPLFNRCFVPHSDTYIKSHWSAVDENGRRYTTRDMRNPGIRPNLMYEYKGYKPHPNGWTCSQERMEQLDAAGRLYFPKSKEGRIRLKLYLDESEGTPVGNVWDDIPLINSQAAERLGYPTQLPKPNQKPRKTSSSISLSAKGATSYQPSPTRGPRRTRISFAGV